MYTSSLWCKFKNLSLTSITVTYNNSLRIVYLTYHQYVVQVLCLPQTILNLSINAFAHPHLAFYVVFISLKTLFLSIISTQIYILEVLCSQTGIHNCTHDIFIVFLPYFQ